MSGAGSGPGDAGDVAVLAAWWREVQATGALPATAASVRTRLVRQVGSDRLPSGPVFLKVMAFPRRSDRWRYLLRALPAAREAAMLHRVAAAGIPCPEVVAIRTARRRLWPHRSLLVLRALPVVVDAAPPRQRLREQAELARRLAAAGLFHPDLNPDNFVRLAAGPLAILDLQSLRPALDRVRAGQAMAARLLLEASELAVDEAVTILVASGLPGAGDASVVTRAARIARAQLRTRVRRCWQTSTEFVRVAFGFGGVEHRRRGELPAGRWVTGGAELAQCWHGERLLEVFEGRTPQLRAFRRKWSWLPGERAVYIPATVAEERVRDELRTLSEGHAKFGPLMVGGALPPLLALQAWRTRPTAEVRR